MSDDVDTIRETLEFYCPPGHHALAALDRVEAERDALLESEEEWKRRGDRARSAEAERDAAGRRAETAEYARGHLSEVNSVERDKRRRAEAERDELRARLREMSVACQEPERSSLVDGEAFEGASKATDDEARDAFFAAMDRLGTGSARPPDEDYSPAYQDEYQRLWHRDAARVVLLKEALRAIVRHAESPYRASPAMAWVETTARAALADAEVDN